MAATLPPSPFASPARCIGSSDATLIRGIAGARRGELTRPLDGDARNPKALLVQPAPDRVEQFVRGIEALFPIHDAAEVVRLHESGLGGDRGGIVVGDERVRAGIPQPRGVGLRIPVAHEALLADEFRLQFRPGDFADELLVRLVQTVVRGSDATEYA